MAEYLQPFQVIPHILQHHPELRDHERIDLPRYANYLRSNRAGDSGVLGINLHAAHVPLFRAIEGFLPRLISISLLLRRDIVAQAVSYHCASVSGHWSVHYRSAEAEPGYDYAHIARRMRTLVCGVGDNIEQFGDRICSVLFYEDCVADRVSYAALLGLPKATQAAATHARKQVSPTRAEYCARFRRDLAQPGHEDDLAAFRAYETLMDTICRTREAS